MSDDNPSSVLLVDDEKLNVKMLTRSLERFGYTVHTAFSGEEALPLLDNNKVDILITDYNMPGGMNGVELIERVKTKFPELPCVVLTGNIDDNVERAINDMGVGYIGKPAMAKKVDQEIKGILCK